MAEEIRIGIVGCGRQTRGNLLPRLRTIEGVHLVACADVDPMAAERVTSMFGFERSYRDYRELFSKEKLDAAIVAIPHSLLKDASVVALEAGCHVFVEKPMAISAKEAREFLEAAQRANRRVMVGYCQRFDEARVRLKGLVDGGVVGDTSAISAGKGTRRHRGWLMDPGMGGGQLLYLGVHITDQLFWTVNSQAKVVFAQVNWDEETGVDDTSAYVIRFDNGVLASVTVSMSVDTGFDFLEVLGTQGRVRAEWPSNTVEVVSRAVPEYATRTTMLPRSSATVPMYHGEMREWVDSLVEDRDPAITGEDGLRVLEIIDAVVESSCTGAPVRLS